MHGNTGSQNKSALARYTFYTSIFLIPLFPSPSSRMSVMMTIRMLSLCLCHSSWCCPGAHVSFVATIDTHVFSPTRAHSFTLSLFHSFTLSLFHSFTLSLFHSLTLSSFHLFTFSPFYPYSLTSCRAAVAAGTTPFLSPNTIENLTTTSTNYQTSAKCRTKQGLQPPKRAIHP
jgi:hypothetical protein